MNKLTIFALLIISFLAVNGYSQSQSDIDLVKAKPTSVLEKTEFNPITLSVINPKWASSGGIENFELTIDSLGEQLTADRLILNFEGHVAEEVLALHPLDQDEILVEQQDRVISISIIRKKNAPNIRSGTPILSLCIVTLDLLGGFPISFIDISGGTRSDTFIPFEQNSLSFTPLNVDLKVRQKTCSNLGSIAINILDDFNFYGFKLFNSDNEIIENVIKFESVHLFDHLEEGFYRLEILYGDEFYYIQYDYYDEDNFFKSFKIWHQANSFGSECCPDNLIVPKGEFNGLFKSKESINLSNGTLVNEGEFIICDY